jgi:hypothetical protein
MKHEFDFAPFYRPTVYMGVEATVVPMETSQRIIERMMREMPAPEPEPLFEWTQVTSGPMAASEPMVRWIKASQNYGRAVMAGEKPDPTEFDEAAQALAQHLGITNEDRRATERFLQEQAAQDAVELFECMTAEGRAATFEALRARFCLHCGSDDPGCPCWNDE